MSYNLTLDCGCLVYVSCDPRTARPHTRVIERRAATCRVRAHEVGLRLNLWDLLPVRGTTDHRVSVPSVRTWNRRNRV